MTNEVKAYDWIFECNREVIEELEAILEMKISLKKV